MADKVTKKRTIPAPGLDYIEQEQGFEHPSLYDKTSLTPTGLLGRRPRSEEVMWQWRHK